ncbi:MAG: GNAT family N-acetyltransferase [Chloroflexota bacterium]
MYGVETFVHPDYQSQGVGSQLMDARFDLLRRLNLRGLVAGSLFVGYEAVAEQMPPEQYVAEVVAGKRFDPNLSKQLRKGFKVRNLIPKYTEEPRTRDYAAAIVWLNTDYRRRVVPLVVPFAQKTHKPPTQSALRSGSQGIASQQGQ